MSYRTEDQVRNEAGITLGFIDSEGKNVDTSEYISGVGQLTTFIQLGSKLGTTDFAGISDKPDGWLLPYNQNSVAVVLETKSEKEDISKKKWEDEIKKNIEIANRHYSKVTGILYNGKDIRVFLNLEEMELPASKLQRLDYYTKLFVPNSIDKSRIYDLTMKINNCLFLQRSLFMERKSARFIAQMLCNYTTKDVYEIWKDMGLVVKDKFGDWILTDLGKSIGGKMSNGARLSAPTFDAEFYENYICLFDYLFISS